MATVQTVSGAWSGVTAGGCPKHKSWINNPQFALRIHDAASFTLSLSCPESVPRSLPIGVVVIRATSTSRWMVSALTKADVAFQSKWKATEAMVGQTAVLAPLPNGVPYIIIPCTFDPGHEANFELEVTSSSSFSVELLASPEAPSKAPSSAPSIAVPSINANAAPTTGAAAAPVEKSVAAVPKDGRVQVELSASRLSARVKQHAAALVADALSQTTRSGAKFVDEAFPASSASLWSDGQAPGAALGLSADPVLSWRRPEEFLSRRARLFAAEADAAVDGVLRGALPNTSFLAACNIVSGDGELVKAAFVDTEHADQGFYAVRLFDEDPSSPRADDWTVVIVDDLLPCGADAKPCFGRCPADELLWVAILEKALAKLRGCYERTVDGGVDEYLSLLTGGATMATAIGANAPEALWEVLMTGWSSAGTLVGCEHRTGSGSAAPPELLAKGLVPNVAYCAVTGGSIPQCGKMVRLRGLHGSPEWTGKWSDNDGAWTNQLRMLMNFRKDEADGTFWMSYDDVRRWFTDVHLCQVGGARLVARGEWSSEDAHAVACLGLVTAHLGQTAGGCLRFVQWRQNPQWLLTVTKEMRFTVSVTLPAADKAVGVYVLYGNEGADARRRRLMLQEGDVAAGSEPRFEKRVVQQFALPPAAEPYIIMPYTFEPFQEGPFNLALHLEPQNAADELPCSLAPVDPAHDWNSASVKGSWRGSGAVGDEAFMRSPQAELRPFARGRFVIFAELSGIPADVRLNFPPIGVVIMQGAGEGVALSELSPLLHHVPPQQGLLWGGAVVHCMLEAVDTPYVVMPYLPDFAQVIKVYPKLGYRTVVYSDVEFTLQGDDSCGGEHCDYNCRNCPMFEVYERLMKLEVGVDQHLSYLATLSI